MSGTKTGRQIFGKAGDNTNKFVPRTLAVAAVGGTVSEISGGKFANGAATAAMVSLFANIGQGQPKAKGTWVYPDGRSTDINSYLKEETGTITVQTNGIDGAALWAPSLNPIKFGAGFIDVFNRFQTHTGNGL